MKTFLHKLTLFFVPLLLFVLSMDIWLRNQNSLYKEKLKGLLKEKDSIQMLILGNSHANYGVDPSKFKLRAYNIANVNQSFYFDKRMTLSVLEQLPNLKYVLISVDYHSLYFSSQGIRNYWSYYGNGIKYKKEKYLLQKISPFLFGYTPNVSLALLRKELIRKVMYSKERLIDFDVEEGIDVKSSIRHGFISFNGSNSSLLNENAYQQKADDFTEMINSSNERDEVLKDITEFIIYLKSKNITPIIFTTPTFHDYNKHLDNKIINQNHKDIDDLCARLDIEYWDYMDSYMFTKEDFYNCDHLNKQGAAKFAQLLDTKIDDVAVKNESSSKNKLANKLVKNY